MRTRLRTFFDATWQRITNTRTQAATQIDAPTMKRDTSNPEPSQSPMPSSTEPPEPLMADLNRSLQTYCDVLADLERRNYGFLIPGYEHDTTLGHKEWFPASHMLGFYVTIVGRHDDDGRDNTVQPHEHSLYSVGLHTPTLPDTNRSTFNIRLARRADVQALCTAGAKLTEVYMAALQGAIPDAGVSLEGVAADGITYGFSFRVRGFRGWTKWTAEGDREYGRTLTCASMGVHKIIDGKPHGLGYFEFYNGLKDAIALAQDLRTLQRLLDGYGNISISAPIYQGDPKAG